MSDITADEARALQKSAVGDYEGLWEEYVNGIRASAMIGKSEATLGLKPKFTAVQMAAAAEMLRQRGFTVQESGEYLKVSWADVGSVHTL
ncbi:hypothetical protein [Xanthomonas campestris]|uniref:hypothetical protein n=1 Tax=Xanthomonas campestris TaxID=339 RepID=UPI0011157DAC|nr:hypothetical protein [Xanthomonas campestris]WVL61786.1 hypothetical protein LLE68_005175 [Xanthomonas campestris pv. barbareae]